jgi:hypothetical protein
VLVRGAAAPGVLGSVEATVPVREVLTGRGEELVRWMAMGGPFQVRVMRMASYRAMEFASFAVTGAFFEP